MRDSGFYLVNIRDKDSRFLTYVNKRISIDSWSEVSYLPDAQLITLCLGATQINIHNIYSPPPASHTDNSKISALTVLLHALRMPGEHVVVGDFNLYHPLWGGPVYPHQHTMADLLTNTMRTIGVELTLPQGIITREVIRGNIMERTIINLVWLLATLVP
jgi:hypothetical protein